MSDETVKNVFVIGLDEANLPTLRAVPGADRLRFHQLLTIEELQYGEVHLPTLFDKAVEVLGEIDARGRDGRLHPPR
ncbi:ATP-grasp domain-containing protein OS=Streptomyces violarus OX=67380 GN=FHS41_007564 PE=4 SV=1 [Streptomyces violarus]